MTTTNRNTQDNATKVAIVTGGAGGIGKAIAAALLAQGCRVVITDLDDARGNATAAELGACFIRHDVTSEQDWQQLMATVIADFGRLDVLVNNAGIYRAGNIEVATVADWLALQNVNVVGVLLGCQHAIAAMKERGGAIINISSGAALRPKSGAALYSATKSAVWSLTRTTALHCGEQGYNIRCNSVHPGMVDTEMVSGRVSGEEALRELYASAAALHPLGRMAEVQDIAGVVAFLASDAAAYLTGVALPVDGGYAIN